MTRNAPPCPICGDCASTPFITAFDRCIPRPENYDYVRCSRCGTVRIDPLPSAAEIAGFYDTDYHCHEPVDESRIRAKLGRGVNRFLVRHRLSPQARAESSLPMRLLARLLAAIAMRHVLLPHGDCRLLDVGCGNGKWLLLHQQIGWQADGVEPAPTACAEAQRLGLNVYHGTLADVPADRRYDVIVFNHVLEHLTDPVANLRAAAQRLAPGGRIEARTPNLASLGFRLYGNCWYPFDAPRHILHFTPATLARAGEAAGLRLVSLHSRTQTRLLCESHHLHKTLGPDFQHVADLETRRALIEAGQRAYERNRRARKWCRRLLRVPAMLCEAHGRGGTLHAVFVNPSH